MIVCRNKKSFQELMALKFNWYDASSELLHDDVTTKMKLLIMAD